MIIPHSLPLTHLRHIWCRSEGEYETLYHQLSPELWAQYNTKITARTDYDLYHRRWWYVQHVSLTPEGALFSFHPCQNQEAEECNPFQVRVEIQTGDQAHTIDWGELSLQDALSVDLTAYDLAGGYTIRLFLDETLAYHGQYHPK